MDLWYTQEFRDAYQRLTEDEQRRVDDKLRFLAQNYRHKSLHAKKWRDPNVWYARVSESIRIFYEVREGVYLLLMVGHHDVERSR